MKQLLTVLLLLANSIAIADTAAQNAAKANYETAVGDFYGAYSGTCAQCDGDVAKFQQDEEDSGFQFDASSYIALAELNKQGCESTHGPIHAYCYEAVPTLPINPHTGPPVYRNYTRAEWAHYQYLAGSDECIGYYNGMATLLNGGVGPCMAKGDSETDNRAEEEQAYADWQSNQGGGSGGY